MLNNLKYNDIEQIFINAAMSILDFLKSVVLEVHHIGSSLFLPPTSDCSIDLLFVLKKDEDIYDYLEILTADGFNKSNYINDYFTQCLIMNKVIEKQTINFIFMNKNDIRVREILNTKSLLQTSKIYQELFATLKTKFENQTDMYDYENEKVQFFKKIREELLFLQGDSYENSSYHL